MKQTDIEFEEIRVTSENLKEVAKRTGRSVSALKHHLELSTARNEAMFVLVHKN